MELLLINFAMNFSMLSFISAAIEMAPSSTYTAQFAVESLTPRILFKNFKYRASILFKLILFMYCGCGAWMPRAGKFLFKQLNVPCTTCYVSFRKKFRMTRFYVYWGCGRQMQVKNDCCSKSWRVHALLTTLIPQKLSGQHIFTYIEVVDVKCKVRKILVQTVDGFMHGLVSLFQKISG